MKKTLLFLAAIVICVRPLPAAEDTSVRVFVLKYKRVEEAALLIRPQLSESASITLTQKLNAMTVTDRAEKLDQVGKALAAFDVPPRGYTFAVKLVRARADVPAGSMAKEIGGIGAKLKALFPFNDYALIDSAVIRGVEGGRVQQQFGPEYTLSFTIRPGSGGSELLLSPLTLSKLWNAPGQAAFVRPLYRAAIPVTLQQTLVLGASRDEASRSALILILLAQEAPGSGAEKGTPGPKSAERRP